MTQAAKVLKEVHPLSEDACLNRLIYPDNLIVVFGGFFLTQLWAEADLVPDILLCRLIFFQRCSTPYEYLASSNGVTEFPAQTMGVIVRDTRNLIKGCPRLDVDVEAEVYAVWQLWIPAWRTFDFS